MQLAVNSKFITCLDPCFTCQETPVAVHKAYATGETKAEHLFSPKCAKNQPLLKRKHSPK